MDTIDPNNIKNPLIRALIDDLLHLDAFEHEHNQRSLPPRSLEDIRNDILELVNLNLP